ncbi:restriction endonuclease subunit S [Lactobacillus delbrueckii]|uniref:restriction endonuclease subunit S n=2 Tax=Lactobacillus delbrueckii TaxID=1584 RepID=UPI001F2AAB6B|nr:restriction endonuclease subunit S [Lactobacillus delbrueckii]
MKDEKKAPKLRFKGFTVDWEQCKLGDVAKINSGKDYKGLQPGKIPVYGTGGYMLSVNDKLSDIDAIGIGRKGTIDKPYYLNAPFWTVDTLFYVTPRGTVDISFMFPLFKNINWKRYDESTGVPSLSKNTIKKIRVSFPQNNEQVKIGDLFQKITQIITLHEEKKHQLESLKSVLLQKMFANKNGYPAVRFEGFSNEWEERKLGDAVSISSGVTGDATLQDGEYRLTRIESISQGTLNVARLGFTNKKPDQKYLLNLGDILYSNINSLSHIGKVALVDTAGIYHGINLLRFQMRNDVDSEFLFQRLNTTPMKNWAVSHANPAVSQASINQTELSKQPISLPTITEQQKIGSFFKQLDKTIALHQRKLDLLKEQKKGFLQKMFV